MAFRFQEVTEAEQEMRRRPSELFRSDVKGMQEDFGSSYYQMTAMLRRQEMDIRYLREQMDEVMQQVQKGQLPPKEYLTEMQESIEFLTVNNRTGMKIMEEHNARFTQHAKNVEGFLKDHRQDFHQFGEFRSAAQGMKETFDSSYYQMTAMLRRQDMDMRYFQEQTAEMFDTMRAGQMPSQAQLFEVQDTMDYLADNNSSGWRIMDEHDAQFTERYKTMDALMKEYRKDFIQMDHPTPRVAADTQLLDDWMKEEQVNELEAEGPVMAEESVTYQHGLTPPSEDMMQQLNDAAQEVKLEEMEHGYSLKVYFENGYHLDVEKTTHTPGQEWEIAVARGKDFVYDTPVTDDMISFASESDIVNAAKEVKDLPNPERTQEVTKDVSLADNKEVVNRPAPQFDMGDR